MSSNQMLPLAGRNIVLGIGGSIAAPKAFTLLSALIQLGADVEVVMSEHAEHFLGRWAVSGVTGKQPYISTFDPPSHLRGEPHIALAQAADCMIVMPCTDSFIGHYAAGIPGDALTLVAKNISPERLIVAPAMSSDMWEHPSTIMNIGLLQDWGVTVLGPVEGRLASGETGIGRMIEPASAIDFLRAMLGAVYGDLRGTRMVISAGGLREAVDTVRYITNASSGRQGHALAEAARDRGALVTLITASSLTPPSYLEGVYHVQSHSDMQEALNECIQEADVYIGAAAVSDFTVSNTVTHKLKRKEGQKLSLELQAAADLIKELEKPGLLKVAFAAETENHIEHAREKLQRKKADLIVLNDVSRPDAGFEAETNQVTLIDATHQESFPAQSGTTASKYEVAWAILSRIRILLGRSAGDRQDRP